MCERGEVKIPDKEKLELEEKYTLCSWFVKHINLLVLTATDQVYLKLIWVFIEISILVECAFITMETQRLSSILLHLKCAVTIWKLSCIIAFEFYSILLCQSCLVILQFKCSIIYVSK